MIRDRVQKICDSFMGSRFEIPGLGEQLFGELERVRAQVIEDRSLLRVTKAQLKEYLRSINGISDNVEPSLLEIFHQFVAKEKSIYVALNMMKLRDTTYIAFLWAPVALEAAI